VGTVLFGAVWVACFFWRKFRAQIIWGTLVSAPLALSSFLFIPQYWTPPSLFDLDTKYKVGIEDVIWAAAVGGIASVIGEIILEESLRRIRETLRKRHYAPFIVMVIAFAALQLWHPGKTIYNAILALTVCALVTIYLRPDLILLMMTGASTFTALYLILFLYILLLYPEFVHRFYNIPNLLGIYIFRIPIEELMFAASVGAVWSVAYQYLQGYRISSLRPLRIVQV
jgi:hypothetical protein